MKKTNAELRTTLENIQEIIKAQRYDEARDLLETLDAQYDNPTVKKWLKKLDDLAPRDPVADMQFPDIEPPQQKSKPKQKPGFMARTIRIAGFSLLGACACIFVLAIASPNQTPTPTSVSQITIPSSTPDTVAQDQSTPIPTAIVANTIEPTQTPIPPTNTLMPTNTPEPTMTPMPSPTPMPIIYNSSELGLQPVIGPVDIPSGVYRITATTQGFIIVDIETISGTCEHNMFGNIFNLSQGQASDGAEALFLSENCRALISISNTQQTWALTFDGISALDLTSVQPSYDSTSLGLQALIGPIGFENGTYRVTATTTGFIIAKVIPLSGTCDDGIMGLFSLTQGQADAGAQNTLKTNDCIAFIQIHNTQQPWSLDFELIQ